VSLSNNLSKNSHPQYRADIDGLRAIAILPVVMFHAFPEYMRSGFVGVDIFFVISGYLISTIIIGALRSGHFDFLDFYARRAKRLFPALLLVLGSTYVFAWLSLFPKEYEQFGKHLAAGAGYAENLVLLKESGYFDLQSQLKPLMHLWSLSVEEQFYIVYPVLLWAAWAIFKTRLVWLIAGLAGLSFALNVREVQAHADFAYFAPHTRFWELLVGALLAWFHVAQAQILATRPQGLSWRKGWLASGASLIGFALVFVSLFAFTRNELYPGWWALIPVAGAFLLLFSGPLALVNRTLLSSRILIAIGLISYPLYLWHWSILSFGRIIENETPKPIVQCTLVIASFMLAWGTHHLIEVRFKNWAVRDTLKVLLLCGLSGVFVVLGLLTSGGNLPWQVPPQQLVVQLESAKKDWAFPPKSFTPMNSDQIYALTHASNVTDRKVLFLGDSNMEQYAPRIEAKLAEAPTTTLGVVLVPIQKDCDILDAVISESGCNTQLNALSTLAEDTNVTKVVLIVAWIKYEKFLVDPGNRAKVVAFLKSLSKGKRLFIFRNIPADPTNLSPDAQISRGISLRGGTIALHSRLSTVEAYEGRFREIDAQLRQIANQVDATFVSPVDYLCPFGTCPAVDSDGNFLYVDAGHLTASYARKAAVFVDPLLDI
jgi:peptidoglycan/LPS O-acetylase OafA/YrhL